MNGTQFDANRDGQPPMTFHLGAHEMIDGFDQAVTGMKVGGKRQVVLPPALGYPNGNGPIPPNSSIVFEIELVSAT
jgi:FKBP-type peptidyl-prolyl cis-trans isomerase